MGVKFSNLNILESAANAIGSNMIEGYRPSPKGVKVIRDYVIGKITSTELIKFTKDKSYV